MNTDDLARLLDELGQRLGPTGEYVFQLAVRQVYVNAILSIGLWLALVIARRARPPGVALGGGRRVLLHPRAHGDVRRPWVPDRSDRPHRPAIGGLQGLLNPEYAALRDIMGAIRP